MLNGPSYALINGESFMEENDTPFHELGKAAAWRKDDGFSLDQGRERSGTDGREGSNGGRTGERTPKV